MKIVKVSSYYKNALKYYYQKFPTITQKTYKEQYEHLLNFGLGWANFYTKAFEYHGHAAIEIIFNAEPLQKAWASEHKSAKSGFELLSEQLIYHNPDIIWFQDSVSFPAEFIKRLKNKIPNLQILIGNTCSPYTERNIRVFREFDFITTCSPKFSNEFNRLKIKNLLLYHAFCKDLLKRLNTDKKIDFVFLGSIIPQKGFHRYRKEILEKIARYPQIDLQIYGNIEKHTFAETLKLKLLYILKKIIEKSGFTPKSQKLLKLQTLTYLPKQAKFSPQLLKKVKPPLFGTDMFQTLANAKMSIDIQGEIGGRYAATMRLFETTGVGTLLIAENKKNIAELFEPEKEIITFDNENDLIDKILWLLENDKILSDIAKNGQQRTLKDHTYTQRAADLLNYINKKI